MDSVCYWLPKYKISNINIIVQAEFNHNGYNIDSLTM